MGLIDKTFAVLKNCTPEEARRVGNDCQTVLPQVDAGGDQVKIILQIVFAIIGVVALIYIVVAGLSFVTSMGNPDKIAKARQSIIFAAIGLAIAASAEIIVTFVIGRI